MLFFALVFGPRIASGLPDLKMKKLTRFSAFLLSNLLISLALSSSASAQTIVCLETDLADVCMELLETETPDTTQNFLSYLNRGTYRSSFFHESVNDGDNTKIAGLSPKPSWR